MNNEVFELAYKLIGKIQETQEDNILAAARCIADTFERGGIIQAFGSGRTLVQGRLSSATVPEDMCLPKVIRDPAGGNYESIRVSADFS